MDELAARHRLARGLVLHPFRGDDIRKEDVGIDEYAERKSPSRPQHGAHQENDDRFLHDSLLITHRAFRVF
ncbi:hypothetical protein D3C83_196080 [compost metagenome]